MMDDGDEFATGGADRPGTAQEVQSVIGVEAALDVEGQVQVQQRHGWSRAQLRTLFFEGQVPSGIGRQAGGAADELLVMPADLGLKQDIGVLVVGDFFVGQEADQAFLEGVEATFDFAFGRSVRCHPMGGAQGSEGALELGMRVEAVGGSTVAEE